MNNDPLMIFIVVFATLLAAAFTSIAVPVRQRFLHIDPKYFRRIKVRFPAFLFVGIGDKKDTGDVKNFGVIVPMFILQLLGYMWTVLLVIAIPVLYYRIGVDLDILVLVPFGVALVHMITVIAVEAGCVSYARRKQAGEEAAALSE